MRVALEELSGICWIEPRVYADPRGFFLETYHQPRYADLGISCNFVQDNHSRSGRGALRGLHYQSSRPQAKLCFVTRGRVLDVIVDMRQGSPTLGCWGSAILCDEKHGQLFIPPGFAHGFCVLSELADFVYKCSEVYDPSDQFTLAWNDPTVAIDWPIEYPMLSEKDQAGLLFDNAPKFATCN